MRNLLAPRHERRKVGGDSMIISGVAADRSESAAAGATDGGNRDRLTAKE
jgi:hypothetical protein